MRRPWKGWWVDRRPVSHSGARPPSARRECGPRPRQASINKRKVFSLEPRCGPGGGFRTAEPFQIVSLVVIISGMIVLLPLNYWLMLFRQNYKGRGFRPLFVALLLFLVVMGGAVGSLAFLPRVLFGFADQYGADLVLRSWGLSFSVSFLLALAALGIFVVESTSKRRNSRVSAALNTVALFMAGIALTHEFIYPVESWSPSLILGVDVAVSSGLTLAIELAFKFTERRAALRKRTRHASL